MAHPKGSSGSKRGKGAGAATKELSADDFERLATIFRPSWKLDEAPFTAGNAASAAAGTGHPQDQNGIHPVAVAPIVLEDAPITAVVRTPAPPPTIPLDSIPLAPPRPAASGSTPPPAPAAQRASAPSWHPEAPAAPLPGSRTTTSSWPAPPPVAEAVTAPIAASLGAGAPQAPGPQPAPPQPAAPALIPGSRTTVAWPAPPTDDAIPPAQRPTVPSWTAEARRVEAAEERDRSPFTPPAIIPSGRWASDDSRAAKTQFVRRGRPSRKPMWIGLAVAAAAAGAGLCLWVAAGSAHPAPAKDPSTPIETATSVPEQTASPPPGVSAASPPPAVPPPKAEPPPEPATPVPPPVINSAAPQHVSPPPEPPVLKAPPAPRAAEPVNAPPVAAAATPPAPKPTPRPKPTSQTIVHDVPF